MATTKRTTTRKTASKKQNQSLPARTARTVKRQPYTSAAIATGAVAAIAALGAAAWFFRNSDKSFGEVADGVGGRIKDGFAEAKSVAADSARTIKDKASAFFAEAPESQSDIAQEALGLKKSGSRTTHPVDPTIDSELKTGAISY